MSNMLTLNSLAQVHETYKIEAPKHPFVSVLRHADLVEILNFTDVQVEFNLYQISMKQGVSGKMKYGMGTYDYREGTMVFAAPGQVFHSNQFDIEPNSNAWNLVFHPDLIHSFELGSRIRQYGFFSYAVNEALHLSKEEINTLTELVKKIEQEYEQRIDRYSQKLIVANIELILDYCLRYYDRQFYLRSNQNKDVLSRFERLLVDYYESDKPFDLGYPTVGYCAEILGLSSNYLSDLLKKETGKTALEHIQLFLLEKAKVDLLKPRRTVSEIAFNLGFEYPNHFTRLFKKKMGMNPTEWKSQKRGSG